MFDIIFYIIKCTLGIFLALAFVADFLPVESKFHQRTHRIRLKNLGATDKNLLTKSSTKRLREYIKIKEEEIK